MSELISALMGWAVMLSGYPMPAEMPKIEFVTAAWLSEQACNSRPCKVLGWYAGTDTIYLDDRAVLGKTYDSSVLVHEMVHYLQHEANPSVEYDCERSMAMEREAYGVQQRYLTAYGVLPTVGASLHFTNCKGTTE